MTELDSLVDDHDKKTTLKCSIGLCPNEAKAKGLCDCHYQRQRRHGTTAEPVRSRTAEANVSFRCTAALKAAVQATAKLLDIEPSEIWRKAAEEFTSRSR